MQSVTYMCTDFVLNSPAEHACILDSAAFFGAIMRTAKALSVVALQRLWSELALLRQEVEQAERNQSNKLVRLTSSIAGARRRVQSRSDRD